MFYSWVMVRVAVRELNQETSRVLARVKAGETVEVTEHGVPVARLVPISPAVGLLQRLVAAGEVRAPTADPASVLPPEAGDGVDVAAELAAAREDERW
jgi:prevent-host-death family protein